MDTKNKFSCRGTTLIEVLLYSLLVSGFLFSVSYFALTAFDNKTKNDSGAEVNDNAQIINEIITLSLRNAKEIITPTTGQSTGSLLIVTQNGDQLNYTLSNGILQLSENGGNPSDLTSENTVISNLLFTNLSAPETEGTIRIEYDINFKNPNNVVELNVPMKIETSATLRPNN